MHFLTSHFFSFSRPHRLLPLPSCSLLHSSRPRADLMEFFDARENWGAEKVRVGRNWRKDELRLKSNEDLHKLW